MAAKRRKQNAKQSVRSNSYYTYGNVAYDVQPADTQIQHKRKTHPQKSALTRKESLARRENRIHSFQVCMVMLLIFSGCIAFMGANVIVTNQEVQIRQKKSELSDLKAQNATLESELAEQIDLDYIKQEAMTRLGMSEPQSYQIVYIDVPKQSYTIQYSSDTNAQ